MGILFSEVKYYKSELIDFTDPALNGNDSGVEIVNDTMHAIFPEITASEREVGFTRRTKFFVSNESSSREMKDCIFYIKQDVSSPDRLRMFEATENMHYSFNNTATLDGATSAVAAGTEVAIDTFLPGGAVAADFVGRAFDILGFTFTVVSAPTLSTVTFAEDITIDVAIDTLIETNDDFDILESDEDFITGKPLVNSMIKSTVTTGIVSVSILLADMGLYEAGDSVVIVDGYFRATFRGVVDTVAVHGTDPALAVITFVNSYTSTYSIPANEGYISNGTKQSLSPGQRKSFWLELTIEPSNAVDAEIINQFQLGTHFDDITA